MKKLRKNCRGYSLVEIIVTFALIGLFMASAAMVLANFMEAHTMTEAVAREQNVASTLMETITGKLSAARYVTNGAFAKDTPAELTSLLTAADLQECQLYIEKPGGKNDTAVVWYVDMDNGYRAKMYVKDGYLQIDYLYADTAAGTVTSDTTWKLGENVYNGCTIQGFAVEQLRNPRVERGDHSVVEEGPTNSLEVTLVLKNSMAGKNQAGEDHTYTIKRSLECYNLVVSQGDPTKPEDDRYDIYPKSP